MFEAQQLEQVRALAVEAFNHQMNTSTTVEDWEISLNRFSNEVPLSVRLYRDRFVDGKYAGSQMQIDFTTKDPYTEVGTFRLMLLPNLPAGDLRDEIFVARGMMDSKEYKELLTYVRSASVREYLATKPRLMTMDNAVFCVCSGQPFQTLQ